MPTPRISHFRNCSNSWQAGGEFSLTSENWDLLLRNRIPYIRARQFLTKNDCNVISSELNCHGSFAEYLSPPVGKMGLSQFEYQRDKQSYFDSVTEAECYRRSIFKSVVDPLAKLMQWVREHVTSNVDVALENGQHYFSGVFRETRHGVLLHNDYALHDAAGWSIESVESQLSWNVYLKPPQAGGSCVLYDQSWEPADLVHRIPDSYGYDHGVLTTGKYEEILPLLGDLVIFNSRNYHEVMPSNESRITMSSFIGQLPDSSIVFWS